MELIDTQWDVNALKRLKVLHKDEELIDTQWDVNKVDAYIYSDNYKN